MLHEVKIDGGELLAQLSEIGITLLLFTIGLKLQPRALLQTKIWGTTVIHMAAMQLLFMAVLYLAGSLVPSLNLDLTATLGDRLRPDVFEHRVRHPDHAGTG